MTQHPKHWLREPLFHFVMLGFALFALSVLLGRGGDGRSDRVVEVTAADITWLGQTFASRWQRPPTEAELRGLVDVYVREEVLYREALAMGLDRDDQIIRRRMVQKLELMTDDLVAQIQPTEAELQAFFQENVDDYLIPERRSFTHVYFNVDQRGETAVEAAERTLAELRSTPTASVRPWELGDRFMLQYDYPLQSRLEAGRAFGQRFAAALFELELGGWNGPIGSGYGLHLVRVSVVQEAEVPEFVRVRDQVLNDYGRSIQERTSEAMYESVLDQYEVLIDEQALDSLSMRLDSVRGSR
jgi:hypothetical protein